MEKVTIILLNYNGMATKFNGKGILSSCLQRLVKTNYKNYDLLVVDNGSTDGSLNTIKSYDVELLKLKKNVYSFAKVMNLAIRHSMKRYDSDYFLLISNDVFVENRNWLTDLVKTANRYPEAGLIACKLVYPNRIIQYAGQITDAAPRNRGRGEEDKGQYDTEEEIGGATGSMVMIRRDVIKKIGFMDENFRFGHEDSDYSLRAKKAGFKIIYNGNVSLTHLEGFTHSAPRRQDELDKYFYTYQVNYAYYAFKHFGAADLSKALAMELLSSVFSVEGKDRKRSIASIRLKNRIIPRLYMSVNAILEGKRLHSQMKRKQR